MTCPSCASHPAVRVEKDDITGNERVFPIAIARLLRPVNETDVAACLSIDVGMHAVRRFVNISYRRESDSIIVRAEKNNINTDKVLCLRVGSSPFFSADGTSEEKIVVNDYDHQSREMDVCVIANTNNENDKDDGTIILAYAECAVPEVDFTCI